MAFLMTDTVLGPCEYGDIQLLFLILLKMSLCDDLFKACRVLARK